MRRLSIRQHLSRGRAALALLCALASCSAPAPALAESADLTTIKRAVIGDYAALVRASYEDALTGIRALDAAVAAFVDTPSEASLNQARLAWIAARVPYARTEAFRFYDGPIDAVEGRINSWPIDETLIDYVEGAPAAGIVNSPREYPEITSALIVALNEKGGEKNITAGFHAIEFLLWGQDLYEDGPGRRSYLDYVEGRGANAARRGRYLALATHLLVDDLQTVVAAWAPDDASNYRAHFVALPADEALADIVKGLGVFTGAELAGERLTVPYETKEQEDEHSCFSDNTAREIADDIAGIQNVFLGRYTRAGGDEIEGRGLRDLIARVDPALAATLEHEIDTSLAAAKSVPPPFDRAIQGADTAPGRIAIKRLITALRAQSDSVARAGAALGLKLNF